MRLDNKAEIKRQQAVARYGHESVERFTYPGQSRIREEMRQEAIRRDGRSTPNTWARKALSALQTLQISVDALDLSDNERETLRQAVQMAGDVVKRLEGGVLKTGHPGTLQKGAKVKRNARG